MGHRRPRGFSHQHPNHSVAELNSAERLEAIAAQYWPGPRDLAKLRVRRLQRANHDAPCRKCGGREWVLYSPRTYTVMCLTCRALAFPRAGDPKLLDVVQTRLGCPHDCPLNRDGRCGCPRQQQEK